MMALSKRMLEHEPGEIELLLPWLAAGTLNARDARRVEEALARDPELARQYAVIREEYTETIGLNETLGAPSARAMQKLFAAIDAEPARKPSMWARLSTRVSDFFAGLSPRTLAWCAGLGALALVLQSVAIGALLRNNTSEPATFQTASFSMREPLTRSLGGFAAPRALVRFKPEARMSDILALLDGYRASIVDARDGGMFRLQFDDDSVSQEQAAALIARLQREKIVSLAVSAQ